MKLNTGKIAIPIEFDNGDKQNIYFNPNDPNLPVRLREIQNKLNQRMGEIEDIELDAEGVPVNSDVLDKFENFQNILFEELDVAFGGEICKVVFKYCSPFAIVDGDFFVSQFLNAIAPEIAKHVEESSKIIDAKIGKYVNKYSK